MTARSGRTDDRNAQPQRGGRRAQRDPGAVKQHPPAGEQDQEYDRDYARVRDGYGRWRDARPRGR